MKRSANAELAVQMFHKLRAETPFEADGAWRAIARLLLTCEVYALRWEPFHGVVVHVERNDIKIRNGRKSAAFREAERLTEYLAQELGCTRDELCQNIGLYWRHPQVRDFQYNNLIGHAFRSLVAESLRIWGNPAITFTEEVDPKDMFPGAQFDTRSKKPKVDIVATKGAEVAALITCRWRYRHDRVDMPDEAMAYMPHARRVNRSTRFYCAVGEFRASRLEKVLKFAPPNDNPAMNAIVHFCPDLLRKGIGHNGRIAELKSLEWLINQTKSW